MALKYNIVQKGFTVVELVVVIVVLGILMSLAVLNVTNSQVVGRDTEREEDVQAIARKLEAVYNDQTFGAASIASYPGTDQMHGNGGAIASEIKEGLDRGVWFAPDVPVTYDPSDSGVSLRAATNTSEDPETISPKPGQGNDIYVYQPFQPNNELCESTGLSWAGDISKDCVRFNLYYWNEADNEVRKIMSRHQ